MQNLSCKTCLAQDVVFRDVWDQTILSCISNRKGPADFFSHSAVQEELNGIKEKACTEAGVHPPQETAGPVPSDGEMSDHVQETPEAVKLISPLNVAIDVPNKTMDDIDKLNRFKRQVSNLVQSHVELIPDMEDEEGLADANKKTEAGKRGATSPPKHARPRPMLPLSMT